MPNPRRVVVFSSSNDGDGDLDIVGDPGTPTPDQVNPKPLNRATDVAQTVSLVGSVSSPREASLPAPIELRKTFSHHLNTVNTAKHHLQFL